MLKTAIDGLNLIKPPEYSHWTANLSGINWKPLKGQEPNRFHRFMQKLCLGIQWTYNDANG